ncbi:MAG: hypothetical protein ABW000_04620 [Actinoplanes sp.]
MQEGLDRTVERLDSLGGEYATGPDAGTGPDDMAATKRGVTSLQAAEDLAHERVHAPV